MSTVTEYKYILVVSYLSKQHNVPLDIQNIIKKYVLMLYYENYQLNFQCLDANLHYISLYGKKFNTVELSPNYISHCGDNFNWNSYFYYYRNLPINNIKLYFSRITTLQYSIFICFLQYQCNVTSDLIKTSFPRFYKNINWKLIFFRLNAEIPINALYEFSESIIQYKFPDVVLYPHKHTLDMFLTNFHPQFIRMNNSHKKHKFKYGKKKIVWLKKKYFNHNNTYVNNNHVKSNCKCIRCIFKKF